MNIPPDDNSPPGSGHNPGLGFDPNLSASMTGDVSLTGQNSSKLPYIIIGLLLAGVAGYFVWHSKKLRDERVIHVRFLEQFQLFEKDELGKFWLCTLGPNSDGTSVPEPRQITSKIDVMFAADFRNYPTKIREECAPIAKDVAQKANALPSLPEYTAALDAYGKSVVGMSDALEEWSKAAPAQVEAKTVGKNMNDFGTAWHSYSGGAATPEIIAYDQFLHCAVPDADTKYKDDIALATYIYESCKQPDYIEKIGGTCAKFLTDKPTTPTKGWKTALQKFAADDADSKSLEKCLRKGRLGKLKDNLSPVGEKWIAFRNAREELLKIAKEALKE